MKRQFGIWTATISLAAWLAFMPAAAEATVYFWVDEDGVKHFSNTPPPEGAEVLFRQEEIAYDQEADRERRENEDMARQTRELEAARERLAEAEAALDETLQRAREAEQQAAALAAESASRDNDPNEYRYRVVYPYWGYGAPRYRPIKRWHHPGQRAPRPAPYAAGKPRPTATHARPTGRTPHPGIRGGPAAPHSARGDGGGGLKLYIRF